MLIDILIAGGLVTLAAAIGLVVVTVAIHAVGFGVLLRAMMRSHALAMSGFLPVTRVVIGLTCWLILIHLVEVFIWGLFLLVAGVPA
jgi:hypothetical protein